MVDFFRRTAKGHDAVSETEGGSIYMDNEEVESEEKVDLVEETSKPETAISSRQGTHANQRFRKVVKAIGIDTSVHNGRCPHLAQEGRELRSEVRGKPRKLVVISEDNEAVLCNEEVPTDDLPRARDRLQCFVKVHDL